MISYDFDFGCDREKVIVPSFVDDTHITVAAQTGIQLLSRISSCLEFVQKWMKLNKLNLNYSKSCFLLYGRCSNYYPWIDRLNIADMSILRINCTKYLGVLIDECLSFREHIDYISLKLARNVGILRKLKYIFPRDILRTLYYSLIHPYLLYCFNVWGSTFPSHLHHIRVLQN